MARKKNPPFRSVELRGKVVEKEHLSNVQLSHVSATGHKKVHRRAAFRAGVARKVTFGDRFFRLFSLFLVCLVLFSAVYELDYSTYGTVTNSLYTLTETVSDAANSIVKGLLSVGEWTSNLKEASSCKQGEKYQFHVKIKGSYYRFDVVCVDKVMWSPQLEIIKAYDGYDKWVGKTFCMWMGWVTCPDYGMRAYKCYHYEEQNDIGGESNDSN